MPCRGFLLHGAFMLFFAVTCAFFFLFFFFLFLFFFFFYVPLNETDEIIKIVLPAILNHEKAFLYK